MCLFGQLKVGLRQGHVIRSSRSDVAGQKLLLMHTVITWCLQKICAHATCPMKPNQLNFALCVSRRRNEIFEKKNVWHDFKSVRTKKGDVSQLYGIYVRPGEFPVRFDVYLRAVGFFLCQFCPRYLPVTTPIVRTEPDFCCRDSSLLHDSRPCKDTLRIPYRLYRLQQMHTVIQNVKHETITLYLSFACSQE